MTVSELEDLGQYSQTEAARYSRIPLSTVHRWFARRYGVLRGELISFDEFVSLLFVRELRDRWRVPLREILEAERDLRDRTGEAHPFAHEALWVAGRDVLVRVRADSEGFMSANRRGQLLIPGVAEAHRVQLPELVGNVRDQLGYEHGRAVRWQPIERVVARPAVQFGMTCIEGTRTTTRTVYEAVEAGDSPELLSRLFRVSVHDIEQAVEWERRLAA